MIEKTGSSKIGSILLFIGGVFQMLAVALHVVMFFGISRAPASELTAAIKPLLYIFNAAVLAMVLFFAYVSFFRRKELIQTGLGRATCLFIAIFYIQRALVEVAVRGVVSPFLGLLCLVAAFYLLPPFTSHAAGGHAIEGAALGETSSN